MATPIKWGSEFLVNTTTSLSQFYHAITGLADGRFVAMWSDESQTLGDDDLYAVHGQIFNADGSKAGAEFLVNTTIEGAQALPAVIGLASGKFVATWVSNHFGDSDVYAQVFNPDGSKQGGQFRVNTVTAGKQENQDIAALSGGGFAVTWTDQSGNDTDIHAQVYAANGAKVGGEILVNPPSAFDRTDPTVTGLTNGQFVVAWRAETGGKDVVRLQTFDANGAKVGAELSATQLVTADQTDPNITALAGGRFVVSWTNELNGNHDVHGQIFNADGTRSGSEFTLDTTAIPVSGVDITGLPDGRFVATYAAQHLSGDQRVLGQLFNADGTKSGDEFIAATTTEGQQWLPEVTVLADGRFVVAWNDEPFQGAGGDGSGEGVRAQIFDPRESGAEIGGTDLKDDLYGTSFDDTMKGGGGSDHLAGMDGGDILQGGAGHDKLDGGTGDDTAVFSGNFNDYTVKDFGAMIKVMGPDGGDTLTGIEHLKFADATIDVTDDGNPLFDTLYYLSTNPDVFQAGVNALDHYNTFGWHEGRDPNPYFDTSDYLAANKDVAASGMSPLDHYHQIGWHEGRDPGAFFDTTLYLINNPDVAAAGIDPLAHYLQNGYAEGRTAYHAIGQDIVGGFDAQFYLFENPDVAAAGIDPLFHFNVVGWQEGRDPNAWFDSDGYLAHYTDVAAAGINPLQHYEAVGWMEGRDASAWFDTAGYLATYTDVAAAGMNPLDHFLQFGIYEGRQPVSDGMWG
jgi:hypothetical protein